MLLHDELYARGLRILAFPCNQAHEQTLGEANNTKHISSTHTGRSERTIPRAPLTHTRCLQFGRQERGSPKEIRAFADGYGSTRRSEETGASLPTDIVSEALRKIGWSAKSREVQPAAQLLSTAARARGAA